MQMYQLYHDLVNDCCNDISNDIHEKPDNTKDMPYYRSTYFPSNVAPCTMDSQFDLLNEQFQQPNNLLISTSFYPDSLLLELEVLPSTCWFEEAQSCYNPLYDSFSLSPNAYPYSSIYTQSYAPSSVCSPSSYSLVSSPTTNHSNSPSMINSHYSPTSEYENHSYFPSILNSPVTRKKKVFACDTCDRSFARKHDLQRHIRVHTGDKPYSCLNCHKSFARTDALKRHLRMEEICRTSPVIQTLKKNGNRRYRNL